MALGSIHSNVGGMAAGLHLKKIHGVLLSLCSDPNPTVHFSAILALSQVAESAGLAFSAYVSSTLGLLAQLWSIDSHNNESASSGTSNSELELPTPMVIAHAIDSLINVLGPDLQDLGKARDLMFSLMKQFAADDLPMIQAEGLRCWEHMFLYDSAHIDLSVYVRQLQKDLQSLEPSICEIAADGLFNLVRRDAQTVFDVAGERFEELIWLTLNERPASERLQNLIEAWLAQTSLSEASRWVARIQQVLTKSVAKQIDEGPQSARPAAEPDLQDEEVAGFAASEPNHQGDSSLPEASQELLQWQVRAFALQCLNNLVTVIGKDLEVNPDSVAGHALQFRIADVIRMAFLASTSSVVEMRVGGLKLINQMLTVSNGLRFNHVFLLTDSRFTVLRLIPTSQKLFYLNSIRRRSALH